MLRNLCSACGFELIFIPNHCYFCVIIFQVYVLSTFPTFYIILITLSGRHCLFHVTGEKTKTQTECITGLSPENLVGGASNMESALKITTDNCFCPLLINLSTYISIPQTPLPPLRRLLCIRIIWGCSNIHKEQKNKKISRLKGI